MSTQDIMFSGSIPEIYDRLMVPLVFQPYAHDIAERTVRLCPRSVLEIAAGTGVVTRSLAANLPAGVRIVATDISQAMLDHASSRMVEHPLITWQQANAEALPFEDGHFDVVLCQFGAMLFSDRIGAYREAKRVLGAGGRYLFNVWGHIEDNVFADEVTRALAEIFPDDPPHFLAKVPHGYHDRDAIEADLRAAGFGDISITPLDAVSASPSPYDVATAYCQGTPLRTEIAARGRAPEDVTPHVAEAIARRFGRGGVSGRIHALVVEAG